MMSMSRIEPLTGSASPAHLLDENEVDLIVAQAEGDDGNDEDEDEEDEDNGEDKEQEREQTPA